MGWQYVSYYLIQLESRGWNSSSWPLGGGKQAGVIHGTYYKTVVLQVNIYTQKVHVV